MKNQNETSVGQKSPFVAPELHVLDITGTATGPFPDPSEFPGILNMS